MSAELISWHGRPSSIVRPSVKCIFSESIKRINTKFVERYLSIMSPDHFFFQFFKILDYLALLDYVSRAYEIKICLSSIHPSSVRLSQLSLFLIRGFLSNFSCFFLWTTRWCKFFIVSNIFFVIFYEYFSFSLTWDPMGAKLIQKATPATNRSREFSIFSWNFFSVVLTQVRF